MMVPRFIFEGRVNKPRSPFRFGGDGGSTYRIKFALISDEKVITTEGGTLTNGAWYTRDLNTENYDPDNIVTISGNQFTLQAGTYEIEVYSSALRVLENKIRLQNITDAATEEYGNNQYTNASASEQASLRTRITITDEKDFEIQHRSTQAWATTGRGLGCDFDTERYCDVAIRKVA